MKKLNLLDYTEIEPRIYQENIAATAVKNNTLCILPTGMGKSYVAILTAAKRLEDYPNSKFLMVAPTRPLVNQHYKLFKKLLILKDDLFVVLTGKIRPEDRKMLYSKGRLFFATPQTIRNDLKNGILDLRDFSLLIIDECHRSVKKYAYNKVIDYYIKEAKNPLILGLTASPGGIRHKIEEVKKNLHADVIEVRTEKDEDVKPYIQDVKTEKIFIELPDEFKQIRKNLIEAYNSRLEELVRIRALNSTKIYKKDLLDLQKKLAISYNKNRDNFMAAKGMSLCAQAIKIEHAIGLIETQGITPLYRYLNEMAKTSTSMATKRILSDPRIIIAATKAKRLYEQGIEHPKLEKLIEIVNQEIKNKKNCKIIIFANYRSTIERIVKALKKNNIEVREFIGQAKKYGKGLSQKEQIQILNEFNYELFNVLVSTSIGEEGLSINEVDVVIFYDSVASEIRKIQRAGRTGRTKPGKIIFLITKDTRDEWYFWSAYHKEKRMKYILKDLQNKNLNDYVN